MRSITLEAILSQIDNLPELPQVATKVLQLLNDAGSSSHDLARIIASDQALTAKILRLANSAYYGVSRRITTVNDAVTILGFSALKSLILIATAYGAVSQSLMGYGLKAGELWQHSLLTAELSRCLAEKTLFAQPDEAFTAGLLHDIGKVALNQLALPEIYRAVKLSENQSIPLHEAELAILGFHHGTVGGHLGDKWNLPGVLCEAIAQHHTPSLTAPHQLSATVALANALALGDPPPTPMLILHDLTESQALALIGRAQQSMEEMNQLLVSVA